MDDFEELLEKALKDMSEEDIVNAKYNEEEDR